MHCCTIGCDQQARYLIDWSHPDDHSLAAIENHSHSCAVHIDEYLPGLVSVLDDVAVAELLEEAERLID